ncbi:hypothetical protein [Aurantiacibacter sp. MUD61]|uniref:hypothetical protein n=1 Tax=Aurantiacibacter sp. MUD61 TaxID=3009083 RepID=UPI0022F1396F|nr:hypothetical protein [Aurantiacibacter sp. MUD61]
MTKSVHNFRPRKFLNGWRIAGWGSLLALLMLPAIAMQFTTEVGWTGSDFVFAAVLLSFLGGAVEFAVHGARRTPARVAIVVTALAVFLTLWANGAVGIIGDEGEPVNFGFTVLALGAVAAAAVTRLRVRPMQVVTAVIAVSQIVMGFVGMLTMPGHAVEWGVLAVFALIWGGASWFFDRAARMAA